MDLDNLDLSEFEDLIAEAEQRDTAAREAFLTADVDESGALDKGQAEAGAWREDGPVVGHWNPGDQTPLLNNSSPSSDAGERQAVRRESGIFPFNLFSFRRRVPCVQHHRRDGHHRG